MGTRQEIALNVATQLAKITEANGYNLTVKNIFSDGKIPMGLNLDETELPAILLIDGPDTINTKHQQVYGSWEFSLQLIHEDVADSVMHDFCNQVFKCLFADSPTAQRNDGFRSIHPNIYRLDPLPIVSDLNLIEANRIYECAFAVHYTARLYNL